jgi:hypothetical protein
MFAGKVLHSRVGSWPYPQTLDLAGKACQGQTPAYYEDPCITVVRSFIGLSREVFFESVE